MLRNFWSGWFQLFNVGILFKNLESVTEPATYIYLVTYLPSLETEAYFVAGNCYLFVRK